MYKHCLNIVSANDLYSNQSVIATADNELVSISMLLHNGEEYLNVNNKHNSFITFLYLLLLYMINLIHFVNK